MNDFQNIKKMILPLIKGSPIIVLSVIISLLIAYRSLLYTNPVYESTVKVKLDDIGYGISSSNLYEDFDLFANTNKIATEVEVLKSKMLIEKTLKELDFGISYYRIGNIRKTELYHESPFLIEFDSDFPKTYSRVFDLHIISDSSFVLSLPNGSETDRWSGTFGNTVQSSWFRITVKKNRLLLLEKPDIDFKDHYQFEIHTVNYLVNRMVGENLDVVAVDEDVAVIRISFKSEIPEKTSRFVNKHAEMYLNDYISSRTEAAGKTVKFIDSQLEIVSNDLIKSESNLENFRLENNIINTRQETETDLRKISQLKVQLANLQLNEAALDSLKSYILSSDNILELAPNFQSFNDLLSTELIKKIKQYQAEKEDLLLKYTPDNEVVMVIDKKIEDINAYIVESIHNASKNIKIKRKEIERTIEEAQKVFIGLPTKEKRLIILEREFQLNQKTFNFLTEKRTEAAIAQAAAISFHRIIQRAYVPEIPISPKKLITYVVAVFLALIMSIAFIYIYHFIGGKVRSKEDLEKIIGIPVAGVVKNYNSVKVFRDEEMLALASSLELSGKLEKHQLILTTSTIANEGKTFVASQLAKAYAALGWKVALFDFNFRNPGLENLFDQKTTLQLSDMLKSQASDKLVTDHLTDSHPLVILNDGFSDSPIKLMHDTSLKLLFDKLKKEVDLVIVDGPATALAMEAVQLMKMADQVFYIIRANYTKSQYFQHPVLLKEEYGIEHIHIILNKVHHASNYSGNYFGSIYDYRLKGMGIISRIKHYFKYYL